METALEKPSYNEILRHLTREELPEVTEEEDFVSKASKALIDLMKYESDVVLKKYNLVPEEELRNIFRKVESDTRGSDQPVFYIEYSKENPCMLNERDEAYKHVIGKLLESGRGSPLEKTDNFKKIDEWYHTDFKKIYSEEEQHFFSREKPLLPHFHNIGANLRELMQFLLPEDHSQYFRPLINLSFAPNLPKDAVQVAELKDSKSLITEKDIALAKGASRSVNMMQTYFCGGGSMAKVIAVPGWTLDLLTYTWNTSAWNVDSFWAEGGIIEELRYRYRMNL